MEDKLLLGLLYLDKKFKTPADIEELLPHVELVLKIASQRERFSEEEEYLLRKLFYKLNRFEKFVKQKSELWSAKLKVEGRV